MAKKTQIPIEISKDTIQVDTQPVPIYYLPRPISKMARKRHH